MLSELAIIQIEDHGKLYISSDREEWSIVLDHQISLLIDLDGDMDQGVPTVHDQLIYVYFPIFDEDLPNLPRLHAVAQMAASLCRSGQSILSHCRLGLNRSGLMTGLILTYLGFSGKEAVELLRHHRPGALFNETFADYLSSLPANKLINSK